MTLIALLLLMLCTFCFNQSCKQKIADLSKFGQEAKHLEPSSIIQMCFKKLIEEEKYQLIESTLQPLNSEEEQVMRKLLELEIKRLTTLQNLVIQTKSTCEPVLKWAQNLTHVFIAIKLSHRWDSPPCLKTISQSYKIQNLSIIFNNTCLVSNSQITFYLNQTLHAKHLGNSEVKKDGVGTYTLILEKQTNEIWPCLFKQHQKIQIWHEIMNRNQTIKNQFEKIQKLHDKSLQNSSKSQI